MELTLENLKLENISTQVLDTIKNPHKIAGRVTFDQETKKGKTYVTMTNEILELKDELDVIENSDIKLIVISTYSFKLSNYDKNTDVLKEISRVLVEQNQKIIQEILAQMIEHDYSNEDDLNVDNIVVN
jgi:hypothetical protein